MAFQHGSEHVDPTRRVNTIATPLNQEVEAFYPKNLGGTR